jgi:hypothetical protein
MYRNPALGESSGLVDVLDRGTVLFDILQRQGGLKIAKSRDCFDRQRTKSFAYFRRVFRKAAVRPVGRFF